MKKIINYFNKTEKLLWSVSVFMIFTAFILFDGSNIAAPICSMVGVTSIIFNAKGNPFGQLLMIAFSIFYGVISFEFRYYGEMLTYLGMVAPMAVIALVSWIKNPFKGKRAQVKIENLKIGEPWLIAVLSVLVTALFYFALKWLGNANLIPSTVSITTSFVAAYLTFRRNPYYAFWYMANDMVLIVLWILAVFADVSALSVVICFFAFLLNDTYCFLNWKNMKKLQQTSC